LRITSHLKAHCIERLHCVSTASGIPRIHSTGLLFTFQQSWIGKQRLLCNIRKVHIIGHDCMKGTGYPVTQRPREGAFTRDA
jgi:hypothetical protein